MFAVSTVAVAFALSIACGQPATDQAQPTTQKDLKPIDAPQQPAAKAEHVFRGKVEKVDAATKALTVNGENVTGWMGPMTMTYTADNPDIFAKVKTGDQITAKVFDGDFSTLHDVQVVPPETK
jgi:Cu/Ag efflux protein CusF